MKETKSQHMDATNLALGRLNVEAKRVAQANVERIKRNEGDKIQMAYSAWRNAHRIAVEAQIRADQAKVNVGTRYEQYCNLKNSSTSTLR